VYSFAILSVLWHALVMGGEEPQPPDVVARIQEALKAANPQYGGGGKFVLRDGKVHTINLMRCKGVHDLSPLSEFPLGSVTNVVLYNAVSVSDLSPLKQCRLRALNTERCVKITDLSPLEGMPLRSFRMYANRGVKDLLPLKGMSLRHLDMGSCPLIDDLSPLAGMKLIDLRIDECPKIADIVVIRGMPIKFLSIFGCKGVKDFSPMLDLPLETLFFSPALLSGDELARVRNLKTLKIMGASWADYGKKLTPEQFWERYDKGK